MNKNLSFIKVWTIVSILFISNTLLAQTKEFSLKDNQTKEPITDATFTFNNQNGITDKNGSFKIDISKEGKVKLSHVNYGKWTITKQNLEKNNIIFRNKTINNLKPITVVSIRPKSEEKQKIELKNQDFLAHDGTATLSNLPIIGSIKKSGNYGADVVLRGFKYDQLNIVIDGCQSATAACPNRMDPPTSQMSPNMLESIEILKGPHSLRFGSGFGGTINFKSQEISFSDSLKTYGRISGGYESNGNIARTEAMYGLKNKKINFSVFGAWTDGNEYTSGNDTKIPAAFNRTSIGTRLAYKINNKQTIELTANRNFAKDIEFPALPMDLRNDDTKMFNLKHKVKFEDKALQNIHTSLNGSLVDHEMDNLTKNLNPRMVNAVTDAKTKNLGFRSESFWIFKDNSKLYAGLDHRLENADGSRTREMLMGMMKGKIMKDNVWQNGEINKTGIFGEYQFYFKNVQWSASTRIELNNAEAKETSTFFSNLNPDPTITQINTSFSIGGLKPLNDAISVGFWLGRAQRSGGLAERFINRFPIGSDPYEIIGNTQLEAEANNEMDLTFDYKTNQFALQFDAFGSIISNYIASVKDNTLKPVMAKSPGVRVYNNLDKVLRTGFEFTATQQINKTLQHKLAFAYTYAEDMDTKDAIAEIPPFDLRYAINAKLLKEKLTTGFGFRYVAKQDRVSVEYGESKTPSFYVLDFNADYYLTNKINISAGVRNLLNKNYYEHLNRIIPMNGVPIYAPGRSIYTNINIIL